MAEDTFPRRSFIARRGTQIFALVAVALALQVAAGVGMGFWSGTSKVDLLLGNFSPYWLGVMCGALIVSFVGYYFVYQEVYRVEHGPDLTLRQMIAVVGTGFGGFFAHGGSALDHYALRASGADDREASVRVASLGGLEHGILGLFGLVTAIVVLLEGRGRPPLDFTLPWAIVPIPGFLLAFWLAERYRGHFRGAEGWRRKVGVFIDSILLIKDLFRHPLQHAPALGGMALFWAADLFAAWAGLAMFGFRMNGAAFAVAMATGMVFSRRTGPLGGAGILTVVLALTVEYSGAPFADAVAGIFAYRIFALWIPMPFSLLALPTIRGLGSGTRPEGDEASEPALEETGKRQGGQDAPGDARERKAG